MSQLEILGYNVELHLSILYIVLLTKSCYDVHYVVLPSVSPTAEQSIFTFHLSDVVPLDLVAVELMYCNRAEVNCLISDPTQVRRCKSAPCTSCACIASIDHSVRTQLTCTTAWCAMTGIIVRKIWHIYTVHLLVMAFSSLCPYNHLCIWYDCSTQSARN